LTFNQSETRRQAIVGLKVRIEQITRNIDRANRIDGTMGQYGKPLRVSQQSISNLIEERLHLKEMLAALEAENTRPKAGSSDAEFKKLQDWESNTPDSLIPAIKHVRDSFYASVGKCSRLTENLCYAALHPDAKDLDGLAPYMDALMAFRTIVGPQADADFTRRLRVGTPPSIFKAFFEAQLAGIRVEIRNNFDQVLRIGVANSRLLSTDPVAWATMHLELLIQGVSHRPDIWVKSVCDKKALLPPGTEVSLEDEIFWKSWRAPKLIHMEPSGNTRYDAATAWDREDRARTESLLSALYRNFVLFLEIELEKVAGPAHVEFAQKALPRVSEQYPTQPKTGAKKPNHPRPKTKAQAKRERVIFGAIQAKLKGIKYCKYLDEQKIAPLAVWEDFPGSYAAGYRAGLTYRKKLQDEKHRYQEKYDGMPPAHREVVIQGSTRSTRS
jgi:hypothetical protein